MTKGIYSCFRFIKAVFLGAALISGAACTPHAQEDHMVNTPDTSSQSATLRKPFSSLPAIKATTGPEDFTQLPPVPPIQTSGVLKAGDYIHLNIKGEPDLSGEYRVDQDGKVYIPLIGAVHIAGQTIDDTQELIRTRLADGYLKHPHVQIIRANIKPVYILGAVIAADAYTHHDNMTVLNLIAMAGGFEHPANKARFKLMRPRDNGGYDEYMAAAGDILRPGDIIYVGQGAR